MSQSRDSGKPSGLALALALSGLSARVPLLRGPLCRAIRGSALRRVARRFDVQLSAEARRTLAKKSKVKKSFKSLGLSTDAVQTVVAVSLMEHYLTGRPLDAGTMFASEAARIKAALDVASAGLLSEATAGAALRVASRVKRGALTLTNREQARALVLPDREDRNPLERMVDQVMDTALVFPEEFRQTLVNSFDETLAATGGIRSTS